jgi:hypothetical protein
MERDAMQTTGFLVATLAATLSFSFTGAAAQAPAAADAEAQRLAIQQNAITDRYLTAVQVAMAARVDTKDATVGQEVSAKTLAETRLADDTVLPRGTRLVGHILQVRAGGPEQGSAILTLLFDRAEVKPGQSVPVRCVIRSVAQNASAAAGPETGPVMMQPQMSGTAPARRGGVAGGMPGTVPTLGGGVGGVGMGPGGVSNIPNVGAPGTSGTSGTSLPDGTTRGSTVPTVGDSGPVIDGRTADPAALGGVPVSTAGRRVADAGESLSGVPRTTGLPGVMLWAAPTASGTLTSMARPISLEVGTQMTLGVIKR